MKKFTKGCLITALILFITGCAFCSVFGVLGGFRQLDDINRNILRNHSINLGGINLDFRHWLWFELWDDEDWDEEDWPADSVGLASKGTMTQTQYRAADITGIDIEIGAANLVIKESEDDYIWIENNSTVKTVKHRLDHGVFKLYSNKHTISWGVNNNIKGKIYLYLPEGMELSEITLEAGAGQLDSIALEADEIDLELGAGTVTIQSLKGDDIKINLGAGDADIGNITADVLSIEGAAGTITVDDSDVREMSLEVGMGNIEASARITGNADINCGMGNVNMQVQGAETDYNYSVECSMGNVVIGNSKYSGINGERTINNGSRSEFDIECGMGNIELYFTE